MDGHKALRVAPFTWDVRNRKSMEADAGPFLLGAGGGDQDELQAGVRG